MYFSKVYLSKVYFCEMYTTCVSSKLCEFIWYEYIRIFDRIIFLIRIYWDIRSYHFLDMNIFEYSFVSKIYIRHTLVYHDVWMIDIAEGVLRKRRKHLNISRVYHVYSLHIWDHKAGEYIRENLNIFSQICSLIWIA